MSAPFVPLIIDDVQPFVTRLRTFDQDDADQIVDQVPEGWLNIDERKALKRYLDERSRAAADALEAKYGT